MFSPILSMSYKIKPPSGAMWRCVGLMVSALVPGLSRPGSSPGRGHCVVFLGKSLYLHSTSLRLGVKMASGEFNAGSNPAMD